jgi:hypothetical protein
MIISNGRARGYPNLAKVTGSRELLRQSGGHLAVGERVCRHDTEVLDTAMLTVKMDTVGWWSRI